MATLGGIRHVRLFVLPDHWELAMRFYSESLGLEPLHRDDQAGTSIYATRGETTLGVERVDPAEAKDASLAGRFTGVSFGVDDIEAAYRERVAAGVRFDAPPQPQPWGGTLVHFRDPANNVLTLVQDRKPSK